MDSRADRVNKLYIMYLFVPFVKLIFFPVIRVRLWHSCPKKNNMHKNNNYCWVPSRTYNFAYALYWFSCQGYCLFYFVFLGIALERESWSKLSHMFEMWKQPNLLRFFTFSAAPMSTLHGCGCGCGSEIWSTNFGSSTKIDAENLYKFQWLL